MLYVTSTDLIERFGAKELIQLTDRTNTPVTTMDQGVVDAACGDASALADTYLSARYALPPTALPPILVRMTGDIARFFLWGQRAEVGGTIERAYDQAVMWLVNVAKGTVKLELPGNIVADQDAGASAEIVEGCDPVFARNFRGF